MKKISFIRNKKHVIYTKNSFVRIKSHCHYAGKFRGVAHSKCNLNYKVPKEIIIIVHNASYDTHFVLTQAAKEFKGELNYIGDNREK